MQFCSHVAMSFAIIELKVYMLQHFSLCIAVVRHVWLCSSHSNVTIQIDACKSSAAGITDNQWLMPGMDITCRLVSLFDFMPGLALGHIKCSYFLLNRKRDFLADTLWNATGMLPRIVLYCKCRANFQGAGSMTHTHTHLLRTVIANSVVECIKRAKTLPLNITGTGQ